MLFDLFYSLPNCYKSCVFTLNEEIQLANGTLIKVISTASVTITVDGNINNKINFYLLSRHFQRE